MFDRRRYLIRQSLASAVISAGMGSLIFVVTYNGQAELSVWGAKGLILDCLPQGFMVGLMSVVPSTLSTRRALRTGTAVPSRSSFTRYLPRSLPLRAVALALTSMIVLSVAAAALSAALDLSSMSFVVAMGIKAFASFGLALMIAPIALLVALDRPAAS